MLDTLLVKVRGTAFWTLDALRGSGVKNSYNEIKKIDGLNSNDEYIAKYQKQKIKKLIHQAVTSTQFYQKFNKEDSFESFPVINKNTIISDQSSFISKQYDLSDLVQMSTSGSTGTPFVSYQNKEKKKRVNAEVIYYSEKAGYSVGKNLIFLRAIREGTSKSPLKQWLQNESLISVNHLKDKDIEFILQKMSKVSKNGSMLLAYASTYDALKLYFEKNQIEKLENIKITGAVSGAEMLYDRTRAVMEEMFNCRVYSRYSNQENGIIGQDDEENNVFIINEANYFVEIFDLEKDEKLPEGELGRIVITDLYNWAMPMIRYDTGDVGSIKKVSYNGQLKKALTNFSGRKLDMVYDYEGNLLSPGIIEMNFSSFPEIIQYQFIQQEAKTYTLKVNSHHPFKKEKELKEKFLEIIGEKASITIEIVDEIPVLSSGKRKTIVNECTK